MLIIAGTLLPGRAWCLEELSDPALGSVSGQAGVGILIDHLHIYSQIDQITFHDPDGTTGSDPAELNLNGLELDVLRIEALPHGADQVWIYKKSDFHASTDLLWVPGDSAYVSDVWGTILTFDVMDRLPVMSAASNYASSGDASANSANVSGLNIGVPTIEFFTDEIELKSITMSSTPAASNEGASFGRFYMLAPRIDLLNAGTADQTSSVEVAAHEGCGLDIALDNIIIFEKMDSFVYYDYDENADNPDDLYYSLTDVKIDSIHLNAITDLDSTGQPHSPGENVRLKAGSLATMTDFNVCQADSYDFTTGNWKDKFLSIDVTSALPAMSAISGQGNVAGLLIGLPALEIYTDSIEYTASFGDDGNELLGTYRTLGSETAILEGRVELAPHASYGMDIVVDDAVIYMSVAQLAYVDLDSDVEYRINNVEWDTMHVNAITLDTSGNLTSPGDYGLHATHLSAANAPAGFAPSPLSIDLSGSLEHMSSSTGSTMAGVVLGLPTVEIYYDEIGIGSTTLHAPDSTSDPAFFQSIRYENVVHACLGGTVEIAPH